ncbi:hypothetical protein [Caulobacter segnis]|uniref:hypothetical protein n=1 Tax=Caulobacter segnis TaxID=88688 RepID=UPI001CBDC549|nr:hypothetical protein [Caulobacter segnis]UAL11194.1 hypothetical protein K8940_02510 [Caulobacter segnis]
MLRRPALIALATAGLLAACTASETRTPARIVMSGPTERVVAQAVDATNAMHGQLNLKPGAAKGTTEATLTLPVRTSGGEAFAAMARCIDAKLSCAFHGEAVSRQVRGSLG